MTDTLHDILHRSLLDIDRPRPTLRRARAEGRIVGRLVEMQLELDYRNDEAVEIEVVHTFPLPWKAVLLGLDVKLGDTILRGVIKAREVARQAYEEAIEEGDRPVLVNVNPDHSYSLELGLLRPGEHCTVRLRFAQVLRTEQSSLRWMLPTTLAPRYGNALREGGFEAHAEPRIDPIVEYPFELCLRIEGELANARMHSPSHAVHFYRESATDVHIELKESAWLDRDFILCIEELPRSDHAHMAEDPFEPGMHTVMATLTPTWTMTAPHPVRMKVLVDCSGSMAGDSIQSARSALQQIVHSLEAGDAFSLSRFGSEVEHQSNALWPVNARTRALGRRWIEALEANLGGTEMRAALLSTLDINHGADSVDVLLITDGLIHAIDDVLQAARRLHQRLFIVGIGSSVAEGVLRLLAEQSGGSCEFVAPNENVTAAILRLFQRMRAPRIESVRLQWPEGCAAHAVNGLPSTLFAGDEVCVFAHLCVNEANALNQGLVHLWGRVEGVLDDVRLSTVRLEVLEDKAGTLARLAAHRRYMEGKVAGSQGTVVSHPNLPALAEHYQLVTADTALYLVQHLEEEARGHAIPELRRIPQMLAAGWGGYGNIRPISTPLDLSNIPIPTFLRRMPDTETRPHPRRPHFIRADALTRVMRAFRRALRLLLDDFMRKDRMHSPERSDLFWTSSERPGLSDKDALTPAGFIEWLRLNPTHCPTDYPSLHRTGLPNGVIDWLRFDIGLEHPETEVVTAFVCVMATHPYTGAQQADPTLRRLALSLAASGDLIERLHEALCTMTATTWPSSLLPAVSHPRPNLMP